jgi:hypothetical protein
MGACQPVPDPDAPIPCRAGCGACCVAPSITTPMPGMPFGKPAGVACLHLGPDRGCTLFGRPERPSFCIGLVPSRRMCGDSPDDALAWLARLERATAP